MTKHRELEGFVLHRSGLRWDILNAKRHKVAIARGPAGPAAGLLFLAVKDCF